MEIIYKIIHSLKLICWRQISLDSNFMRYDPLTKQRVFMFASFVIFLCSPDGFGDRSRGFLTDEHVASESLQSGVLRDEAEVAMIARVKRAERYIFQRVEIVVTGSLTFLQTSRRHD